MPLLINLGKAITLIAWLMMAYNLAMPFEGKVAIILNILLGITCIMHCFQVAIFHMLFKTLLPLTKQDYLQVFIFGIFSLLDYRQRVMTSNQRQIS